MNTAQKVITVILCIACGALLCTTIVFFMAKNGEESKSADLRERLGDANSKRRETEAALKAQEVASAEMKGALTAQEERAGMLSQRLEEEKKVSEQMTGDIKKKDEESSKFKSQLETEARKRVELVAQLKRISAECTGLKKQVAAVPEKPAIVEEEPVSRKGGISLGTVVVSNGKN